MSTCSLYPFVHSFRLQELVELEGVGEMVVELVGVAARDSARDPAYDPAWEPARDLSPRGDVIPEKGTQTKKQWLFLHGCLH